MAESNDQVQVSMGVVRAVDSVGHRSCEHEAIALHTCPYLSDVNDDDETLCDCCDDCQTECARDI